MGKNRNISRSENYVFGMIVLFICVIGILGSIYSSGLYAWLSFPALLLGIAFRKNKPQWLYALSIIVSILFIMYFLYGFIGSF